MRVRFNQKEVEINVKKLSIFGKFRGLMFRRPGESEILLFEFSKPTRLVFHSLFCFFDFYVLWLDDNNKVLEIKKCKTWKFRIVPSPSVKSFSKVIEIPINKNNENIIKIIVEENI